jgi:hypothetical protein
MRWCAHAGQTLVSTITAAEAREPRWPGRSSSRLTRLSRALQALIHEAVVTEDGPHPRAELGSRRLQVPASSFSPAVPPACHKQRAPAVSSGQSRSIQGGRWAGRRPATWGGGGARNCMACKGSGSRRSDSQAPSHRCRRELARHDGRHKVRGISQLRERRSLVALRMRDPVTGCAGRVLPLCAGRAFQAPVAHLRLALPTPPRPADTRKHIAAEAAHGDSERRPLPQPVREQLGPGREGNA